VTQDDSRQQSASLTSSAALITAVRAGQMVVNYLLSIWLSRRLEVREHGVYLQVLTLASVLPVAICAPLGKLVTYFLPHTKAKSRLCRDVAGITLAWGVLLLVAIAFVPGVIELADRDTVLVRHRVVAGVILGLSFPYALAEYVMIARGVPRKYAGILVGVALLLLVGVGGGQAWLWWSEQHGAAPGDRLSFALWGTVPALALQAGASIRYLLHRFPDDDPAAAIPSNITSFFLPLFVATFVSQAGLKLDAFLLPQIYPADANPGVKALYFRGASEIPVLGAFAITAVSLIAPAIARHHAAGEKEQLLDTWRRSGRMVALFTVPAVGLAEAVAHELLPLMYGGPYAASVPVFQFVALVLVMRVFLPQVLLEFTGAPKANLVCSFATLVLSATFSLTCVFVLHMGWVGFAAGGTLAIFVANWGVGGAIARRHLHTTWTALVDWGSLVRLVLAATVGFLASAGAALSGIIDTWPALARIAALCVVYGIAFLAAALPLRAVHRDDLATLRGIVTRRR
jgi:O-antigen/teichoic acid export membrane protein